MKDMYIYGYCGYYHLLDLPQRVARAAITRSADSLALLVSLLTSIYTLTCA